ncbi:hypothetical protein LZ24_02968 [Desulfobotulus alkaliphilus]|uniref:SCP2 domain-containing protein n=1 Tax=Desulfobotulus alkaliphilus TaxID=622671 RepID=A0A562R9Q1_9BACT|nr:hypothetical protein [Desulfobotulus alkaliphilus]TWI65782.1 hypothetical protein LZ24_02968 [Desulfobotulus alkaliphilus]
MKKVYEPLKPGRKWFKELVAHVVFFVLGRAFQSAAKLDAGIRREVAEWEEGFTLAMCILPKGPSMLLKKVDGRIRYAGWAKEDADLIIRFKNIESAFLVLTPQMGSARAFAENRLSLVGDVARSMSFVRCLDRLLAYLYPAFICRPLVKRMPPVLRPIRRRLYIYTLGIPFGL